MAYTKYMNYVKDAKNPYYIGQFLDANFSYGFKFVNAGIKIGSALDAQSSLPKRSYICTVKCYSVGQHPLGFREQGDLIRIAGYVNSIDETDTLNFVREYNLISLANGESFTFDFPIQHLHVIEVSGYPTTVLQLILQNPDYAKLGYDDDKKE